MTLSGAARRRKGHDFERVVANHLGAKRNIMSGGSPLRGGDLVFDPEHPLAAFSWECKAKAKLPHAIYAALEQARQETLAVGARKSPAAVLKGDSQPAIVCFYLDDFVPYVEALAELGQGQRVKSLVREIRRKLDMIEGMA